MASSFMRITTCLDGFRQRPGEVSLAQSKRLAFLVGFDEPSADELRVLGAFRRRGGRLVVFHSASPALAELMGVRPLGYTTAPKPGAWSRMDFAKVRPEGMPASIRQTSTVLQRAAAIPGRSRVLATWSDRRGVSTGEAAWIVSGAGYWMTHVLLADGDERAKAQLCAAICGAVDPSAWTYAEHRVRARRRDEETRALALAQVPRRGEIHAVWEHSGCGLYPGDWPRTVKVLRERRVTDLFVNVAGAGFAHYPSAVLPRSKTFLQEGDQLAACLAAAAGSGIRVHAWLLCFTGTRGTPAVQQEFAKAGWRLKNRAGALTEYLDPSKAPVRERLLAAVDEMQRLYPSLAGIHLDFVRWYEGAARPKDAAGVISAFVAAARRHVARPRWLTTAVLGKYPACVASVGQDWDAWLTAGSVDYVVPMDYSESNEKFAGFLAQHAQNRRHGERTIVGIGVTANESRLDARRVIEQVLLTRRYGLAGNALFDLDVTLEDTVLPYLALGLW